MNWLRKRTALECFLMGWVLADFIRAVVGWFQ